MSQFVAGGIGAPQGAIFVSDVSRDINDVIDVCPNRIMSISFVRPSNWSFHVLSVSMFFCSGDESSHVTGDC